MGRQKRKEIELSTNMQNLALRSDDFAGDEIDEFSETGIEASLKVIGHEMDEGFGGYDDYALGI
ncbi:MAG: hypothetical protein V4552_09735 [Pseudomonadota bacterium]